MSELGCIGYFLLFIPGWWWILGVKSSNISILWKATVRFMMSWVSRIWSDSFELNL